MPFCDTLYITRIEATYPNADTFFPELDMNSWEVTEQDGPHSSRNGLDYTFFTLKRIR